jgi:hypothetical protein
MLERVRKAAAAMLLGLGTLHAACARSLPPTAVAPEREDAVAPEPEDDTHFTRCGTGRDDVWAFTLETSYRTLDEVCRALAEEAAKTRGWYGAPCTSTPIQLPDGAPFTAAIVRIDRSNRGPLLDSSRHFLAIELDQRFYLVSSLDVPSASAGRIHPISVTAVDGSLVENEAGRLRLFVRLRATLLPASCDTCVSGAKPEVEERDLAVVCATGSQQRPMCTDPIEAGVAARVVLDTNDLLGIKGLTEDVVHPIRFPDSP